MRKLLFMLAGCAFFAIPGFCEAEITAVNCTPRYPWNGKVDVDVTLANTEADAEYVVSLALVRTDGSEKGIVTLDTEPVVKGNGVHTLVWDAPVDYPNTRLKGVAVKATIEKYDGSQGVYLVFDLSEGKDAKSYPHRYTLQAPDLSSDVCRTTELWMRRVPAGTFTMGYTDSLSDYSTSQSWLPPHQVVLSKPYYIGVFEMTQKQYNLLTGDWPSFFSNEAYRDTRPVERTSYQLIRGLSGWYDNPPTMSSTSLLYGWKPKFGFERLDLPTEAQWEFACRAGVSDRTYDMTKYTKLLGRNNEEKPSSGVTGDTVPDVGGTAKVGSYQANPWGLYDMMGNVAELVGDGDPYNNGAVPDVADYANGPYTDPRGPTAEWMSRTGAEDTNYVSAATFRGGAWSYAAGCMLLYYRTPVARSLGGGTTNYLGFRLCITCE